MLTRKKIGELLDEHLIQTRAFVEDDAEDDS